MVSWRRTTREAILACLLNPRYKHQSLDPQVLSNTKRWLQEESKSPLEETKVATGTEEEENPKRRRVGTAHV